MIPAAHDSLDNKFQVITSTADTVELSREIERLKNLLQEARFELLDAAFFIESRADSVIEWTDRWPSKGPFSDRRQGVQDAMGRFKGRAAALRTTCELLKAKEAGQ